MKLIPLFAAFAFVVACGSSSDSQSTGAGGGKGTGAATTGSGAVATCDTVCAKQATCPGSSAADGCAENCPALPDACKNCLAGSCDENQCASACGAPSSTATGTFTPEDCTASGQTCSFNSDCASGQTCNTATSRCFDPDPIDLDVRDCSKTPCAFDSDCSTGYGCNTATSFCAKK
jgi:hypothetical protein